MFLTTVKRCSVLVFERYLQQVVCNAGFRFMWQSLPCVTASTLSEKFSTKDDLRRDNERLCADIETLSREYKKFRQIVEQLRQDYEISKEYDPLRRYDRLKGMVKRTVMHVKLAPDQPNTGGKVGMRRLSYVQGCKELNHQTEIAKRREEKYASMS